MNIIKKQNNLSIQNNLNDHNERVNNKNIVKELDYNKNKILSLINSD